ncbi:MAG: hypothetical protein IPK20_03020 [Betaproteobacteria bacterium]|nr:hypothetical protein [Betaproteobacteria bacterium]
MVQVLCHGFLPKKHCATIPYVTAAGQRSTLLVPIISETHHIGAFRRALEAANPSFPQTGDEHGKVDPDT